MIENLVHCHRNLPKIEELRHTLSRSIFVGDNEEAMLGLDKTNPTLSNMPNTFINVIIAHFPTIAQLRGAPTLEIERVLLRAVVEYCADGMHTR